MHVAWMEWIGYGASAMIVLSLLMTNVVKLRKINSIGAILFIIYGYLVQAYPVAISNLFILGINVYQLYKFKRQNT
jgi:hypothetical protein